MNKQTVIKEWPLKKTGQELFFGYVIGMGVYQNEEWDWESTVRWVHFRHQWDIIYKIPHDESLIRQLAAMLEMNMYSPDNEGEMYGKVWIKKLSKGYDVFLP